MSQPSTPVRVTKGRMLAVALTAFVSCTAATTPLLAQAAQDKQVVVAEFRDVSPILVGNDVKIAGAKVGTVADLTLQNGVAKLAMELDPSALPLHADAQATVKPVSLLGERFVDLNTGSADAPLLPSGAPIPITQTKLQTDLDQALNIFDGTAGQGFGAIVGTLGEGFKGNGADVDGALKALAPSMQKTDQFVRVLQDQNAVLNQLIDSVEPVARSLASDNGKTIDRLVDSTNSLMTTTKNNHQELNDTLKELPGTLTAARGTLGNLANAADPVRDSLRSIRPVTDDLNSISDELMTFSDSADPALDKLVPVLDKGEGLLKEVQPVARHLHELGPDFKATGQGVAPIFREASQNVNSVLGFVRNWALTTNGRDGLSHYFRAFGVGSPEIVTSAIPGVGGTGNGITGRDPAQDSGQPNRNKPEIPGLLAPKSSKDSDGGVTGLNQKQESGALGFMLGGGK
jgi:phospholipid/cholesterol/gamma-HCH transport system substrate-binding protein